jgi:hypothetical protein
VYLHWRKRQRQLYKLSLTAAVPAVPCSGNTLREILPISCYYVQGTKVSTATVTVDCAFNANYAAITFRSTCSENIVIAAGLTIQHPT